MTKLTFVCFLFFLSGISGLIYEVIWIRQFGNIFGNTIYSSALVTAIFMCGLGFGGHVVGLWVERRGYSTKQSLIRYGVFEIGIAIFGLISAFALSHAEVLSSSFSQYDLDNLGWHQLTLASHLWRYFFAFVLLTPMTFLMGGTLTLLIHGNAGQELQNASRNIGLLYGFNTFGAACGALAVDLYLVPQFGLGSTQAIAAFFNLLAAIGAFQLSQDSGSEKIFNGKSVSVGEGRAFRWMAIAIFLSGLVAMGMEIFWFRFLISVLGAHRVVISTTLAVILIGIWIGSTVGGFIHQLWKNAAELFALSQIFFVALAAICLFSYSQEFKYALLDAKNLSPKDLFPSEFYTYLSQFNIIAALVLPAAIAMGFSFPLANGHLHALGASVGKQAGGLYLANTLGAVMGSLLTGFYLLPVLGMQRSLELLIMLGLISTIPILKSAQELNKKFMSPRWRWIFAVGVFATIAILVSLIGKSNDYILAKYFEKRSPNENVIHTSEGVNEVARVTEVRNEASTFRILYTDGQLMSGTLSGPVRYMRSFVHLPLLQSENPTDVLIICFGAGNTAHAASLYPSVKNIEIADLSRNILEQAPYFEAWNHNVLKDPRVSIYVNDGRQHLRMQGDSKYDLVTLEPPPLTNVGVSSLYSVEFYTLVSSKLKEGGFITQWLPAAQTPADVTSSAVQSFIQAFPESIILSGFKDHFILMGRKNKKIILEPAQIQEKLKLLPEVQKDLLAVNMGSLLEIAGSFVGGHSELVSTAGTSPAVSDDNPIMEYVPFLYLHNEIPSQLFNLSHAKDWCPNCFAKKIPELKNLEDFFLVMEQYYLSPGFRYRLGLNPSAPVNYSIPEDRKAGVREAIKESYYLKGVL